LAGTGWLGFFEGIFMKIGLIEFINSLPVDLGLIRRAVAVNAQMVQGLPAALNEKILNKEIEISPVSAFFYAEHQKDLLLFPDLSISSRSGVQSVLLLSRHPMASLAGKTVAFSGAGRTTPALFEILCRQRYGFVPALKISPLPLHKAFQDFDAALVIGDQALLAKERFQNQGVYVIDLAKEWETWTKKPFVFAVWVTRRDFFEKHPEKVSKAHQAFLDSKAWGLSHPEEIILEAKLRTGLSEETLKSYFSCLSYDFDDSLKEGMNFYFNAAAQLGLLPPAGALEEISCLSRIF
jgi:chorismate dehydratase